MRTTPTKAKASNAHWSGRVVWPSTGPASSSVNTGLVYWITVAEASGMWRTVWKNADSESTPAMPRMSIHRRFVPSTGSLR